jgi:hypothetical protein
VTKNLHSVSDPGFGRQEKFYGKSGALCVEETKLHEKDLPFTTVNLELAPREGENVRWERKINLQLSRQELPELTAVCMGFLPSAEFKRGKKGVVIERQPGKLFFRATAGSGNLVAIPLGIGDCFRINAFLLTLLQEQSHSPDINAVLAALRSAAALARN